MTRARDVANIDGILTTTGDTFYASAAGTPARLGIGSTGQVLKVNGGVPTWGADGGKVLQVVNATITSQTTIATTTLTDTGITATITPTLSTSKILVLIMASQYLGRTSTYNWTEAQVLRGATTILDFTTGDRYLTGIEVGGATSTYLQAVSGISYLDSPATTSATTYKLQAAVISTSSAGTTYFQLNSTPSSIILMEIGA